MKNNRLYESIMTGLNEALEEAKSEAPVLNRNKMSVEPVKFFNAYEVKKIRNTTGLSQSLFAFYLGVSN